MEHSLHNKIQIAECIAPAALTATTVGAIIDSQGFESMEFVVHCDGLDGEFTVLLEQGDDPALSDATVVPADNVRGTLPVLGAGDTAGRVGSISKQRYQRLTLTETSANAAGTIGALAILGHPKNAPTAEQTGA